MSDAQLIHGDCLEVMPTLDEGSVAMVFADLPYGVGHTLCAWDKTFNLSLFWCNVWRACLANSFVCATAVQPFTTSLIVSMQQKFKYTLVWSKRFCGSPATAKSRPLRVHEDVCVFAQGRPKYNPLMTLRDAPIKLGGNECKSLSAPLGKPNISYKNKVYTHKFPTSILDFSVRDRSRGMHPTQKPVALLEWLIKTYSNPGDTILDPTAGSGTTAIAALRTGRKAICIEKDKGYYDVMCKRVADEQAQLALRLGA